ncbi:hypothetical protein BME96_01235 [Virgibacillus halodenitrificans]|uniref:Uncharacterized protein n=1 Tax=Virgibacillus halodenitrificans TaxID=1482 RepID=A0AAC9IUP2_VIRHA|nr:hypothetical protein BME96_01235 [Virgibacillus halodenitrificans]
MVVLHQLIIRHLKWKYSWVLEGVIVEKGTGNKLVFLGFIAILGVQILSCIFIVGKYRTRGNLILRNLKKLNNIATEKYIIKINVQYQLIEWKIAI